MKIDVDQVIQNLQGESFKYGEKDLTLKVVCVEALGSTYKTDETLGVTEKIQRYALAIKIQKGGKIDFTAEDIVMLKKYISQAFGIIIMGRAFSMLENEYNNSTTDKLD